MKNFKEKLDDQFKSLSITVLNEPKYKKHLYADYVELICLFSEDFITQNEIIDRLQDNGEIFNIKEIPDGETGLFDAETNDSAELWINTVFECLNERSKIYASSYPFIYDKNHGIKLKERCRLNEKQKIYLFLLIASSLNFFTRIKSELTSDFEKLSEYILKAYLPNNANVYGFGSNSTFTGNAPDKIRKLAKEINLPINERIVSQVSIRNSKEEGLDVVGWIPFSDNNPNTIIILGQCACGKDWFGKQNETLRYDRFYLSYLLPFTHALFLSGDFRNNEGLFQIDKDFTQNQLIFERRRLIDLSQTDVLDALQYTNEIVEKSLSYFEDVV